MYVSIYIYTHTYICMYVCMYIYVCVCTIYIGSIREPLTDWLLKEATPAWLAFTRYCFTSKLYCVVGVHHPFIASRTCKAYPIAILLHDHCAMHASPHTPPLYAIHHQCWRWHQGQPPGRRLGSVDQRGGRHFSYYLLFLAWAHRLDSGGPMGSSSGC